jgi:TetR/AcrR family transcriptional regulator, repressor for uid operon
MRKADPELQSRRRAEIVAAAERCFVKRGFHRSSMQNIAAASGLSMGLLYRYFANKEAIIEAAAEQDQALALASIVRLPVAGNVIEVWVSLITEMARAAAEPDYAALANEVIAEASRSAKLRARLQANDAALADAIKNKLEAQHQAGAIATLEDPALAAEALLLLFDGLAMRSMLNPPHLSSARKSIAAVLIRAILS